MKQQEGEFATMWEKSKREKFYQQSEEERWKDFVKEYRYKNYVVLSEFGAINMSKDAMKDVFNGENLSYDEYLQVMFHSRNNRREYFESYYYDNAVCTFKGQIRGFDKKKEKVLFHYIYICGFRMDGTGYEGKEDHVWMDSKPFEEYQVGDYLSFSGEIYRYLKTGSGKQISFGIRNPGKVSKIKSYELPTEEELFMQSIDQVICEICMYNEHCYLGNCIAEEWRENMRKMVSR